MSKKPSGAQNRQRIKVREKGNHLCLSLLSSWLNGKDARVLMDWLSTTPSCSSSCRDFSELPSWSSYCPDFSDMCDDSSEFWDFIPKEEKITKQQKGTAVQCDQMSWDASGTSTPSCDNVSFHQEISPADSLSTTGASSSIDIQEFHKTMKHCLRKANRDACELENLNSHRNQEAISHSVETEDSFWDFLKPNDFGNFCEKESKAEYGVGKITNQSKGLNDLEDFWDFLKTNDGMNSVHDGSKSEERVVPKQVTHSESGSFSDFHLDKTKMYNITKDAVSKSPATETELVLLKQSLNIQPKNNEMDYITEDEICDSLSTKTDELILLKQSLNTELNNIHDLRSGNDEMHHIPEDESHDSPAISIEEPILLKQINVRTNETVSNTPTRPQFFPCISSVFSIKECSFDRDNVSEENLNQSNYFKHFWDKESEVCSQNNYVNQAEENILAPSSEKDVHNNISRQDSKLLNASEHRKHCKRSKTASPFGCSQFVVKDFSTNVGSRDFIELNQVLESEKNSHNQETFGKESDEIILNDSCIQEAYNIYCNSRQNNNDIDNFSLRKNNVDQCDLIKSANQPISCYEMHDPTLLYDNSCLSSNVPSTQNRANTIAASNATKGETLSNFTSSVNQNSSKDNVTVFLPVQKFTAVGNFNSAPEDGKGVNTTPLYLIMPKSANVSSNQTKAQLFRIINNNDLSFKNAENYENNTTKVLSTSTNSYSFECNNSSYQKQPQSFYSAIPNAQTTVHGLKNIDLNPLKVSNTVVDSTVSIPIFSTRQNDVCSFSNSAMGSVATKRKAETQMVNFFGNNKDTSNVSLSQANSTAMKPSESAVVYMQSGGSSIFKPVLLPEMPLQNHKNIPSSQPQAIKYISLGKDKKAIQQTSIPLKLDNVQKVSDSMDISNATAFSANLTTFSPLILTYVTATDSCVRNIGDKIILNPQNNIKPTYTEPVNQILSTGSKNIGTCFSNEVKIQQNHTNTSKVESTATTVTSNLNTFNSKPNKIPFQAVQKNLHFDTKKGSNFHIAPYNADNSKGLLTLNILTPSTFPLSVLPVRAGQSSQSVTEPVVSKIILLPSSNQLTTKQNLTIPYHSRQKMSSLKKCYMKSKKLARKTVRELLNEKRQKFKKVTLNNVRQEQSSSKPVFKTPCDDVLLPTATTVSNLQEKTTTQVSQAQSSHKRPNILILPSSIAKQDKEVSENSKISRPDPFSLTKETGTSFNRNISDDVFAASMPYSQSSLKGRQLSVKGHRPRHYDMNELIIGCFKVQDDVDSHGRFRSKFKVLFSKRQFLYDFPVSRCNQVDLNDTKSAEKMVRIIVPFKTVLAMNFSNRRINVQVSECPLVYLGHIQARSGIVANATVYDISDSNDSLWGKSVGSSLLHKITLRKRQAEKLQTYLCLFDQRFLTLTNSKSYNLKQSTRIYDASPFEEELALKNLRKFNKSKKLFIRRLPQWDCAIPEDQLYPLKNGSTLLQSSQVCSCRISCRSVRCSCVKAAKSCGSGGSVCLCTNCDNPLNVLESLGLNLEFSLSDTCLFQNIYQIPNLLTFLERDVKLSCCNTIARIRDCIPGTMLCPNVECNVQLEYSWCRGVICYSERNPRNHCSFCGQCCFSNGRHCTICNRCYVATSKRPNCPNCHNKQPSSVQNQEHSQIGCRVTPIFNSNSEQSNRSKSSKPEIVLLDGCLDVKSEEDFKKSGEELSELLKEEMVELLFQ